VLCVLRDKENEPAALDHILGEYRVSHISDTESCAHI